MQNQGFITVSDTPPPGLKRSSYEIPINNSITYRLGFYIYIVELDDVICSSIFVKMKMHIRR